MSWRSEQPPEEYMTLGLDMVGREHFVERLVGQLTCDAGDSSELRVISVLGEKAIGKTAVVRSVYDQLDIKRHFKSRAWVRVLVGSGLEDILFDVLRQTTTSTLKNVDRLREPHLSEMLEKTLIKRRYLVVLDNLQCVDLMEKLLILFADSRNGSRVIITTCNVNMSLHLGPRHSGHVELFRLTEEESHKLLIKSGWTGDPELTGSILRNCNGYPPVIRLLGRLSTVREDPHSILADGVPRYYTLGEIISLSYDSLPAWLKPCLLYLVLFPRESEIPVRRLFNIWLADGLLCGQVRRHCTQECLDALDALVVRKMIHVVRWKLDRTAKTCLMPGFLHDFLSEMAMDVGNSEISDHSTLTSIRQPRIPSIAVKILMSAKREQEMTVRTNNFKVPRQTRVTNMSSLSLNSTKHRSCSPSELQYIAIKMDEDNRQCKQMHMSNGAKTQYVAKFFRSFMLFTACKQGEHAKDIDMFLKPLGLRRCFPLLKVLDLEHVYKPKLPKRLGTIMPNLRYLGLRWTALVSLPRSVQFMRHLDTLDLKHTNVASVPSSILKNGSLQHLYVNEVCLDRSFRRTASYRKSLAKLKTLWGLYIGGKSAMLDVLGKLTGLRKLGLTCHYMVANNVAKSVTKLTNLQSLRLRSLDIFDHSSHLELSDMSNLQSLSNLHLIGALTVDSLRGLPNKLQILTLSMTQLQDDPMQVLKELKGLTSLRLLAGSYQGRRMTCTEGTFPALQVLKLWKLELLTEWTIEASALPCLQELEIRNCTRLTPIVGLEHVRCLEEITLTKVKGAVALTAKTMCPKAVVIARGLAVSPPQEGHNNNEEEDDKESHGVEPQAGDDNDLEETDSSDDSGTDGRADELEGHDDNEEDDDESNSSEVESGDDNNREEGDSNVDGGTDEAAVEEQEGHNDSEKEDQESNGGELEAGDDNDREEGDSDDNRVTNARADEEQEGYNSDLNQDDNEEGDDEESNGKVGHGIEREEGDSNGDTRTAEGADKEQENEEEDEAANGIGDGDEDEDKDANDYEVGEEDEDKDENDYKEGEDDDDDKGGEGGGGDGNEEEGNDGDDSDYQDAYTDNEQNDEGEDLQQQNTDEAKEREENKEKEDENRNEGDNNDDECNDEGEDEEEQIVDEAVDENENDHDEKGDDGDSRKEEDKEKQNGAEAGDGDDSDHGRDLNDDDDEGKFKSCEVNMKLELNMEMKANVKNELTLTVI